MVLALGLRLRAHQHQHDDCFVVVAAAAAAAAAVLDNSVAAADSSSNYCDVGRRFSFRGPTFFCIPGGGAGVGCQRRMPSWNRGVLSISSLESRVLASCLCVYDVVWCMVW